MTFQPVKRLSGLPADDGFPHLLPSQARACAQLKAMLGVAPVVAYSGAVGMGHTTTLRAFARDIGAFFVDAAAVVDAMRSVAPRKWDEAVIELVERGMARHGTVIFDGYSNVSPIRTFHKRLFGHLMAYLQDRAVQGDGKLLLSGHVQWSWDSVASIFGPGATLVSAEPFAAEDYAALLERRLGAQRLDKVDVQAVYRAAPMLDGYQLGYLAGLMEREAGLDTAGLDTGRVIALIEHDIIHSNLKVGEVEELSFDSLPGSEHIAEALETHVVLPFRRKDLAAELGLKPRRGVLLYGPPGTGKTSIGRALAHRMKGRFFLLDGSFVTEPPSAFFNSVAALIKEAKANAPSVLFIDDADVLFGIEHISGLARYLLSLLDGIESETASNVCVMMTAMDASKVPEALLRSGRVELWLETRLPDRATRARILERWMDIDLPGNEDIDYSALADAAEGFTPADLRRLAADAKLLYAADRVAERPPREAQAYLAAAVEDLVNTRAVMAQLLADDTLRIRH